MEKSKKIKQINPQQHRQAQKLPSQMKKQKMSQSFLSVSWQMIVGMSVIFGIIAFVLLLVPRVTLEIGPSLDSRNPFKDIIYMVNNGYFKVIEIKSFLANGYMKDINQNNIIIGELSGYKDSYIQSLLPDQKAALKIDNAFNVPPNYIQRAEFDFVLNFKFCPLPIKCKRLFRIKTERTYDNKLIWTFVSN